MRRTRSHRYWSCTRKVKHMTAASAAEEAAALFRKDQEVMTTYPCRYCGGWHVGHEEPAPLREKKEIRNDVG